MNTTLMLKPEWEVKKSKPKKKKAKKKKARKKKNTYGKWEGNL